MADLVTDDRADGAVVHGVVRFHVEEGRLQDGCRKNDFIQRRAVISVDRLRCHTPLGTVDGSTLAFHVAIEIGHGHTFEIAEQIVRPDLDRRVIAPRIRIADFRREFGQLVQCLGLGGVGHPVQFPDADLVSLDQVADEIEHSLFRFGREMPGDVHLAHDLTESAIDDVDCTTPAFLLLLGARKCLAVKFEILLVQRCSQPGSRRVQYSPGLVGLPRIQVGVDNDAVKRPHIVTHQDNQAVKILQSDLAQETVPVEVRHQVIEFADRNFLVQRNVVACIFLAHMLLGKAMLQGHDR